jgi:selenocysteine-specific elongation factor
MHVIGTAGHVDHGKSTLVEALTGIDPDRLKEEKEREMTIDLGFAWLKLDGYSDEIGIVDVPGHRDFIQNMLAGVGGIDLALLVIAADEGVMPQTREHLAILDLLGVEGGIVPLTKTDLVDDQDWLELVTLDVSEVLAETRFREAPIVPVSARTGEGLDELRTSLQFLLDKIPSRPDTGRARLPVDRVFTLAGFGTVVTGTLTGGQLSVGDTVEVQPGDLKARIRGLQTHKTKLAVARPGSRVAINLTGIERNQLRRGQVLSTPGVVGATVLCDVRYRHLPDIGVPLKHNVEVKVYVGSAEVMARSRVIGSKHILPGDEGWLQLVLSEPVAMLRGDRFILRRPSPGGTLGGGTILDPYPGRRHRRFKPEILAWLETQAEGTPQEHLLQVVNRLEPTTKRIVFERSGLDNETATAAWEELLADGLIVVVNSQVLSRQGWQGALLRLEKTLGDYHRHSPLRLGMPREELRSRLGLSAVLFNRLLEQALVDGVVKEEHTLVHLAGHSISFTSAQQARVDELLRRFSKAGVNSPSVKDVQASVGEDVYFAMIDLDELVQLNEDVVYATAQYDELVAQIQDYLKRNQRVNAAQVRDLLGTSRKYAIALLEHLDDVRVTRRVGDERELIG